MKYRVMVCWLAFMASLMQVSAQTSAMDVIGINEHLTRYSDYQDSIDEIVASGTKWVRFGMEWGSIETSKGVHNTANLAKLDAIVNQLHDADVNILFLLGFTAQWASSQPSAPWDTATRVRPANWSDWEDFVTFITTRYQGKITHWEVWNEPDHLGFWKSSVADYVTLLQKASVRIRAADSQNVVVMGGLAMTTGTTSSFGLGTFFDQMLGLGAASSFDTVNYHAYGSSARYMDLYAGMMDVMSAHNIKQRPIWITETGYTSVGDPAEEPYKADVIEQTFLTHTRLGIERIFIYVYRNPIVYNSDGSHNLSEENFGLVDNFRTPLPAFYHYQALEEAATDFALQKNYPSEVEDYRTLTHVVTSSGDGAFITDYDASGSKRTIAANKYMYFRIQDQWLYQGNNGTAESIAFDVTYLDLGTNNWFLQYDGKSASYQGGQSCPRTNTGQWLTKTFTVNDAWFANRQNNWSDFRIFASGADLTLSKVAVRRVKKPDATITLGSEEQHRLITRANDTNPTHEGYAPIVTVGGEECRKIEGNSHYLYFDVDDQVAKAGDTTLKLTIRYWDDSGKFLLQYNSLTSNHKGINIFKTGTNTWQETEIILTDANFTNAQSYWCDFRIGTAYDGSDEYISRVTVRHAAKAEITVGSGEQFHLIQRAYDSNPSHEGYAPVATMGGESCLKIEGNSHYLYFDVASGVAWTGDTHLKLTIRYWDDGGKLLLQYNSLTSNHQGINIFKTGTNTWQEAIIDLTDADFTNDQSYSCDFRIGTGYDGSNEYISRVTVSENFD